MKILFVEQDHTQKADALPNEEKHEFANTSVKKKAGFLTAICSRLLSSHFLLVLLLLLFVWLRFVGQFLNPFWGEAKGRHSGWSGGGGRSSQEPEPGKQENG